MNSDGVLKATTQAGTDRAIAVAQFAGVNTDLKQCIFRGETKVTFGANVTVGAMLSVSGNKAINQAVAGSGLANGFIISDGAADLDTGYIYFDGAAS